MPGIIVGGGGSAQETTLDKILKGLALANQGIGIAGGIRDFQLKGAQLQAADDANKGIFGKADILKAGLTKATPEMQDRRVHDPFALGMGPLAPDNPLMSPLIRGPEIQRTLIPVKERDAQGNVVTEQYVADKEGKDLTDKQDKLRTDYENHQITKQTGDLATALGRFKEAIANPGEGGASNIGAVTAFFSAINPGVNIRTDQSGRIENASGLPDQWVSWYNQLATGNGLDDKERKAFYAAAVNSAKGQLKIQSGIDDQFRSLAKQNRINAGVVSPVSDTLKKIIDEPLKITHAPDGRAGALEWLNGPKAAAEPEKAARVKKYLGIQ